MFNRGEQRMKFGVTINIGNYNSLRCESSDHKTLKECYQEILLILRNWNEEFDSIKWWIKKLKKKIGELND